MAFEFVCPMCKTTLSAMESLIGFRIRCLKCRVVLEIKAPEDENSEKPFSIEVVKNKPDQEEDSRIFSQKLDTNWNDPLDETPTKIQLWSDEIKKEVEGNPEIDEKLKAAEKNIEKDFSWVEEALSRAVLSGRINEARKISLIIPEEMKTGQIVENLRELKKIIRRLRRIHRKIKVRLKAKNNQGLEQLLSEYLRIDDSRKDVRQLMMLLQEERLSRRLTTVETAAKNNKLLKAERLLRDVLARKWIIPVPETEIKLRLAEIQSRQTEEKNAKEALEKLYEASELFKKAKFRDAIRKMNDQVFTKELPATVKDQVTKLRTAARARQTQFVFTVLSLILGAIGITLFLISFLSED